MRVLFVFLLVAGSFAVAGQRRVLPGAMDSLFGRRLELPRPVDLLSDRLAFRMPVDRMPVDTRRCADRMPVDWRGSTDRMPNGWKGWKPLRP